MKILVLGGTRFFGIHLVYELLEKGHQVTIATRGQTKDKFGDRVKRITVERTNSDSLFSAFKGKYYDVVYDNLAYCSNDIRNILVHIKCKKYIMVSSAAVYNSHFNTKEEDFNPLNKRLKWCSRDDFPYDESKRQAECALAQKYSSQNAVMVRYPFVIGEDDYTKRLYFYVEHIIKQVPMFIDNGERQLSFIRSDEAGKFLSFLADKKYSGAINGSSYGTISINEMITYVENKTGIKAIYSLDGEIGPYNGVDDCSINTELGAKLGFEFSVLENWIYELLDKHIMEIQM